MTPTRLLAALVCLSALALDVPAARAAPEAGRSGRAAPEGKPAPKPPSLDDLFARLRASEDPAEAKGIARLIERRMAGSGSPTADLLTDRARQAVTAHDFPLAAELMDRVTALEPNWSEGWNRRATVFWLLSDKDDALADLQRALVLEPRHFEAWAAMGRIYESLDDKARALAAFRRARALYPQMEKIGEAINRLTPEVDGRDL
ncbi:tetratricopeptide repeat protein [Methylobacterium sp. 13MFTsu3.1M2]|uniref:tetratricopeptide repeat protein n=1 Tax=Methylobacterium sp. 13MFTsu3.1M2 TaxID=1502776 RepID=UPI0008DFD258|nr:tetratricopeptide repeat protein [Methylobacterium sp. 13MFTsu3.1M2]SFE12361.1 Tetratricopeptide repeat-containing protein [Methylobacterium sp. 13MFTsu3.1M2]